jgi:basic membrane lipoprotein Med (substrate-binding protein (PBP1-ABC) superfamily)
MLVAAGCGGGNGGGSSGSSGGKKVKTALVLPCATSDTWCKQGYDAAKTLQRQGKIDLKVTTGAPQDTAAVAPVISQYAQAGNQLVLAHSTWEDATDNVAKKFPNTAFATYGLKTGKNVAILDEPIYQGSYLAGMLAGGITKTNVIGGTAGQDVPLCHAELEAFKAGAQRTNPNVRMLSNYIGDWNDAAKGQQASQAQINQKADVLLACGGGPATGMAQAIKSANVSGFGYVGDMSSQAPKNMVGSVIYNLVPYFDRIVADVRNDKFQPGKTYNIGLAQGGVALQLNSQYAAAKIPPKVMAQMEQVQQQIKSAQFKVPFVAGT